MIFAELQKFVCGAWDIPVFSLVQCFATVGRGNLFTYIITIRLSLQGSGGLTSQPGGSQHSYAAVTSQRASPSGDVPTSKSHGSHMTPQSQSHDQRQLYSVEDEDDERPPSTHAVHS